MIMVLALDFRASACRARPACPPECRRSEAGRAYAWPVCHDRRCSRLRLPTTTTPALASGGYPPRRSSRAAQPASSSSSSVPPPLPPPPPASLAEAARASFAACVARGSDTGDLLVSSSPLELGLDLAEAALLISAEDDALISHSPVPFPVDSYLGRVSGLAEELLGSVLPPLSEPSTPREILAATDDYLYSRMGFRVPSSRGSGHPGWASNNVGCDPRHHYLHLTLSTRRGSPQALAVLHGAVLAQLVACGRLNALVRVDCPPGGGRPKAVLLAEPGSASDHEVAPPHGSPGSGSGDDPVALAVTQRGRRRARLMALRAGGMELLRGMLLPLKRAYWPWGWPADRGPDDGPEEDSETGSGTPLGSDADAAAAAAGFVRGVDALRGESEPTEMATARFTEHRLRRGIFTASGGGDPRRALAATERLLIVARAMEAEGGEAGVGAQRRDLAVQARGRSIACACHSPCVCLGVGHDLRTFRACSAAPSRLLLLQLLLCSLSRFAQLAHLGMVTEARGELEAYIASPAATAAGQAERAAGK